MTPAVATRTPSLDNRGALAELREILHAAHYTAPGICAALRTGAELSTRPADIPVYLRRLVPAAPISTLIGLFVLGVSVSPDEARKALAPLTVDQLEAMGLVETQDAGIRGAVRLLPHEDLVIACDRRPDREGEGLTPDWVTGLDPPTILLANLTVRRPVRATLDMGTGCGVQALLAARHSDRVLATDVNPRAIAFASFNAALNQISNVECRQGSWFEPVADQRFGLIVCNPPYVISPESDYIFRDSGLPGDRLCRQIAGEVSTFLEEGGFAQMLVSWVHSPSEEWAAPLREWVSGRGSDAWLLHAGTEDPLTHAAQWNRPALPGDVGTYAQTLDRWLEYFRESGIEGIAFGGIILRRRSNRVNWIRADDFVPGRVRAASDHIQNVFAAQDYLAQAGDTRTLLDEVLAPTAGLRMEQALAFRGGSWGVSGATVRLEGGLGFEGSVDLHTTRILPRLDGRRRLGDVLTEAVASERVPQEQADKFASGALRVLGSLLELGFLTRSADGRGGGSPQ
jgi:methylase of polypeptide subunit release factors